MWHPPVVRWLEQEYCRQPKLSRSRHTSQPSFVDPWVNSLFKMPCANTSWTGPLDQVTRDPLHRQATGMVPEMLVPLYAGFWGPHQSLSPAGSKHLHELYMNSRDQQGQLSQGRPNHHTPPGNLKLQMDEAEHNPLTLHRIDILNHFSQASSNIVRNLCQSVARLSPSWRQ